ncbi:MAG: helix-turn-helix domain-containing protein [Tannerellaceae bacterium]|nr:helix-turn-helix domain-containing protein [Tannerellaceae bacterium]
MKNLVFTVSLLPAISSITLVNNMQFSDNLWIILLFVSALPVTLRLLYLEKKNRRLLLRIKEMRSYNRKTECPAHAGSDNNPVEIPEIDRLFILADQTIRREKLYLNPDLVRDDVIKLLSVNRNAFIRAINKHAESFTDYINDLRMEAALKMLRESTPVTIEYIAGNAGFGSARSFYRLFKRKYNTSPSKYRKRLHQNQ